MQVACMFAQRGPTQILMLTKQLVKLMGKFNVMSKDDVPRRVLRFSNLVSCGCRGRINLRLPVLRRLPMW